MTILEKKSNRKKISIINLVEKGEYSASYALMLVENLSDSGKLTDSDYEELATYLEEKLNSEENEMQEENSSIEETPEENEEKSDEENTVVDTNEIEERLEDNELTN